MKPQTKVMSNRSRSQKKLLKDYERLQQSSVASQCPIQRMAIGIDEGFEVSITPGPREEERIEKHKNLSMNKSIKLN